MFEHESWKLMLHICIVLSFYPKVLKLGLLSLYMQWFRRYRANFSIDKLIIGNSFRSFTYALFLPQGVEIELIFALRTMVYKITADFQNCYIGHESFPLAKVPEVGHALSLYPEEGEIELNYSIWPVISEIWANSQNYHTSIWAWMVISQFNGKSTPKGSYSAKTGDNDCNVNSSRYSLVLHCVRAIRYQAKSEQNVRQDLIPRVRHGEAALMHTYLGMERGTLAKVPEVVHTLSFYPKATKLNIFSLYRQRFLR